MKYLLLLLLLAPVTHAEEIVKTVSVKGEGEVKVRPDEADMFLQVRTKAKDAKTAQAKNAKEMARVQKALQSEFKIDEKYIQTTGFSVNPEYRYDNNGKQTFLGYIVDHSLTVKVKKVEKLGEMVDSLVGKGTEDVSVLLQNVNFGTEKRQEYEIQAMEIAMKNAEVRAAALAKFAKRSLKGVLRISDSNVQFQPPPFQRMMGKAAMMEMASDAGGTQISAGEIVIGSNVSVDYLFD
jgi:uncharacterized protein YggE